MSPHANPILIRALGLLLPLALAWALWVWRQPERRPAAAVLLACAWNASALLVVQLLAAHFDWWRFDARGGLILGMPVDLYLGWVLWWGAIPFLALPRASFWLILAVMLIVDLCLMPMCAPVLVLGRAWLVGEACAMAICLAPAQLLARWTLRNDRLAWRAMLQMLSFSGLLFGLLPAIIIEWTGGSWSATWLAHPAWLNSLMSQLLLMPPLVCGVSALQEFVTRGRGTPLPYDPPRRLVTSGIYAYVSNPMQLATCLLLVGWGVLLNSIWVSCTGLVGLAYSAGLAAWDEGGDLRVRFGDDWLEYRRAVRSWWPRWRPHYATNSRLYVAESCGMCGEVGRWLLTRRPVALLIIAAEDHPARDLRRMTYESSDGESTDEGVAAFARALEHLQLGWALMGCTLRLPMVCWFVQLLVDATGGAPRSIRRRAVVSRSTTE